MLRILFLVIILTMMLGANRPNKRVIKVVTFPLYGMINENGTGPLIDLLKYMLEPEGLKLELTVMPIKRAAKYLCQNKFDMMYPSAAPLLPCSHERSTTFILKEDFIYSVGGKFQTVEELKQKTLGIVMGYPFAPNIKEQGAQIVEASSDEHLIQMMHMKRIDALMSDGLVIAAMKCKLPVKNLMESEKPFYATESFLAYINPELKPLVQRMTNRIKTLLPLTGKNVHKIDKFLGKEQTTICK